MNKIFLLIIALFLTAGIIAQTTPVINTTDKPVKTASSKTSSTTTTNSKSLKKTVTKKTTHHVMPVKKSVTPAQTPPQPVNK